MKTQKKLNMKAQRLAITLAASTALALASGSAHAATIVANAGGDWIDAATLPTGWSYLESDAATGGTESALTASSTIGGFPAGTETTGFGGGGSFGTAAILGDNADGGDYEIFGDGAANAAGVVGTDLLMHPSNNAAGQFVIARYTLSVAGDATITGGFHGTLGSRIGSVYHNGVALYTSTDTTPDRASTGAFNLTPTLAIGDTISFVVDSGGNFGGDETALRATITVVPEPSAALLGLGGLAVIFRRRRK